MKYYIYLTDLTQKRKIRKIKFRILEKANELINLALSISNMSIACGIASLTQSEQAMGGKPTILFRPIVVKATMGLSERDGGRNIEFGCHPPLDARLTFRKVSYLIYFLLLIFLSNCKKDQGLEWIKRSTISHIDLYLVPNKFNILENDWINIRYHSHFDKQDLIRHLRSYGRTLEDLKNIPELQYLEMGNTIRLNVAKSAHSTSYEYDTSIPIIFYGPNWIEKGKHFDVIHQQHIVPTLSKILKIRNPNGVETKPLDSILKTNSNLPEIIVTIVIDQGGQQYYKAHPEVPVHISEIKKEAAYFINAIVGHVDTETAVGHAAIGTGAYPRKNGIAGNGYLIPSQGKLLKNEIYAIDEISVNPTELLTETLADVLDNEYQNKSEVVSQSYALRASIGMAGHGSSPITGVNYQGDKDMVYWLSNKDLNWNTDNRYYSLPSEALDYNPLKTFKIEYPNGWEGVDFNSKDEISKKWGFLMGNPAETRSEAELFRKVILNNIILKNKHNDGIPDLAYLTIKSTDAVAHQFGFESLQAKETFREADKQVGLIFEFLKKEYGDKFILIITADHGGTPLPEISGGNRYTVREFVSEVNMLLPQDIREKESIIERMSIAQISLNHEIMKHYNISEKQVVEKILKIKVNNKNFFKNVYTKTDLK